MSASSARALADIFTELPETDQHTLFEFAQFLQSRAPTRAPEITQPLNIARPDKESVVGAIKRLKLNYPMLSQKSLLNETSEFMMQHMMHGKPAAQVIDELEAVFKAHYVKFTDEAE
ncbi:hypothetical protein MNBD_GAMMA10-2907 [hydrothermal vent metagenome]|uniref:Crp/Fnr family transcriptional regulator n=1 Tax=hydrothermal vent metagenome TaxID=652676 RepID=A0A3B0XWU6_9ZZZZ